MTSIERVWVFSFRCVLGAWFIKFGVSGCEIGVTPLSFYQDVGTQRFGAALSVRSVRRSAVSVRISSLPGWTYVVPLLRPFVFRCRVPHTGVSGLAISVVKMRLSKAGYFRRSASGSSVGESARKATLPCCDSVDTSFRFAPSATKLSVVWKSSSVRLVSQCRHVVNREAKQLVFWAAHERNRTPTSSGRPPVQLLHSHTSCSHSSMLLSPVLREENHWETIVEIRA